MTDAFRMWRDLAVHYRLFIGFGVVWFAIVLTVAPVGGGSPAGLAAGFDGDGAAASAPRGTLGAVSTPSTPGNDLFASDVSVFDPGAGFEGFDDSSVEEPAPSDGSGGQPEDPGAPPPCPADEALPAPAVGPAVDAARGAQGALEGATGQPAPGDPAGTAEGALCTPSSSSSVVIGGLRPIDMLRLLLGLPA